MYVGLPLLIIIMLISISTYQPESPNILSILLGGLILIVGATLLRIISTTIRKDFRFHYAKGCFQLLSQNADKAEKIDYIIMALNSYNKYLKRKIKLQISNINNIYSKIIADPLIDESEFIKSLSTAFQSDDNLQPTRTILNFLDIQNSQEVLTKEPLWEKVKEWGAFLVAIIPVAISIVQLVFSI
jgi:hypothetical protein